ncbi:MAG: pyridoxal-phosphate dependent enzyme [Bacteroidales bacterium]|nr:pyridoxal-phosphate dependent enzyme [Bacteroidales bacterium]MCF8390396.1 pyridoxal-phosphate dependent enzyme [Bacteroidales bacterium]
MDKTIFTPLSELKVIHERQKPYIHNTPVLTSRSFNDLSGTKSYFKCENFQKMGAFKMRGALNGIMALNETEKSKGVVTHSSGNFAQAMCLSAKILGVKATVVMPRTAPKVKKDAVRSYGGFIIECEPTLEAREAAMNEFSRKTGAVTLHPSNQKEVIDGNSTAAIEILEAYPDLDAIITPVGGGGLLAGTALAAKQINPEILVYAGEPMNADDAFHSLRTGIIQPSINPETIADGLRTQLGDKNFPIIQKYVTEIIRVEESEIIFAMKWIWERMKIIIEPSSAVPVAAILKDPKLFMNKKIGIILSGGNVEMEKLPF